MESTKKTVHARISGCSWVPVTGLTVTIVLVAGLALAASAGGSARAPSQAPISPGQNQERALPSLLLSPAVIRAKGSYGQGITTKLTLSNDTDNTLGFEMVAQDVTTKDGKRIFVHAGEIPGSIAATAIFSPRKVVVKPHSVSTVQVTFTIPQKTALRAAVAIFKGTTIAATKGSVGLVASLGTLFVFTLSDDYQLAASPIAVMPQTSTSDITFKQWLTNTGSEPVMPEGVAAILDGKGALVGKTVIPSQRLLPGQRLLFKAPYPAELNPGHYRVLVSFEYGGKPLISSQDFTVK